MMVPLYGFIQGDPLGILILAQDTDRIFEIIDKAKKSSRVRVDVSGDYFLFFRGKRLNSNDILKRTEIKALDRVDVVKSQ